MSNNDLSELGCIIQSCIILKNDVFLNFVVEFFRRQTNEEPHSVAKVDTYYS